MSDTSIPTSARLLARSSPASSSSRTWQDTGLLGLPMSFSTLPRWGMTCAGDLYELPTPERPTVGNESSSLPTPTARDYKEQTLGWTWQRDGVTQEDTLPRALTALLPTPVADHSRGLAQPGTDYSSLPNVAIALLNTPRARQGENQEIADRGHRYLEEQIATLLPTPRAAEAQHSGRSVPAKPGQQQGLTETVNLLPTPKAGDGERGRDLPRLREDQKSRELATAVNLLPTPRATRGGSATETVNLLPTPTAQAAKHGSTPDVTAHGYGSNLWDIPHLLPTPTVMDMGSNYTPEEWEAWKAKQREAHANGNGHGASLTQEAISLQLTGASTPPPFTDGSTSSAGPRPAQPPQEQTDDQGFLPYSWNG